MTIYDEWARMARATRDAVAPQRHHIPNDSHRYALDATTDGLNPAMHVIECECGRVSVYRTDYNSEADAVAVRALRLRCDGDFTDYAAGVERDVRGTT